MGSSANWFIGEGGARIRSMSNPNQYGQPDTYEGAGWYTGADDGGGVHTNSGVQNFWFYLLSEGGTGVNDKGYSYSVAGLGIEKASQITYRSLSTYLVPTTEYADARLGSMYAAEDLYGNNSPELQSVIEAWNAVGVLKPALVPTIGIDSDTLSFLAEAGTTIDTVELSISNFGLDSLEISNIQISGSDFQLLNLPAFPLTLDYDETISVKIVFNPANEGEQAGLLSVSSNDPADPTKTLVLKGTGYTITPAVSGAIYSITSQTNSLLLTLNQADGSGTRNRFCRIYPGLRCNYAAIDRDIICYSCKFR